MSNQPKSLGSIVPVLALVAAIGGVYFAPYVVQGYRMIHLYDEDRIVENFLGMDRVFPVRDVPASTQPSAFREAPTTLPETFTYKGTELDLQQYLADNKSTGMLVLKDGAIAYEEYWLGHSREGRHISWSVAKSFVSALVGIAVAEGKIASIELPITDYLPELFGTGYEGVAIRDILEMSSGVGFNEDYADYDSDINRFGRAIGFGGSMSHFAKTLRRAREPGTYHHYVSIDTQVLAMLLVAVSGESVTSLLHSKIWEPVGMAYPAYWLLDASGMEVALGGLNATLRDFARLGQLYLDRGRLGSRQIVPASWVRDSTTPRAAHLTAGPGNPQSSSTWGYGYQWWIPDPDLGDYTAAGIYNQYVYVNPKQRVVIAKNSANRRYIAERQATKDEHIAMFRAIANALGGRP
ncbi:MAG: serine hydrolase [Myxococcota bacterium]|nr:serine hydrolase [Myxococcota bacterium]